MDREQIFDDRLHKYYDELKWLYCEFYQNAQNPMADFTILMQELKNYYDSREPYLKELDISRANDANWYKDNNFIGMMMYVEHFAGKIKAIEKRLPYLQESNVNLIYVKTQRKYNGEIKNIYFEDKLGKIDDWEKITKKCHEQNISIGWEFSLTDLIDIEIDTDKFKAIINELLTLTNWGIDVIYFSNIQVVSNEVLKLKQHNLLRMLRIISEIVCPGTLLVGNINSAIKMDNDYFGTKEKPQLHILVNQMLKNTLWHTVATQDVALLKHEVDKYENISTVNTWQNLIHDETTIQWNLDYEFLQTKGIDENMHKAYLNEFFIGQFAGSFSCGLIHENGICGSTASLCGIEYFDKHKEKENIAKAINLDILVHGFMLALTGIPLIYSGDEIAQYNNYDYQADKRKQSDNQYVHRSSFNWRKAGRRKINNAIQAKVYQGINTLEKLRMNYNVFKSIAKCYTIDTWSKHILAIVRETDTEKLIALYNFSEKEDTAWLNKEESVYKNLLTGQEDIKISELKMPAYSIMWLWRAK